MVDFSSLLKYTPAMAPDTSHAGNNIPQQDPAPTQHLHHPLHETISPGGNSAGHGVFCNSRLHALLWIARIMQMHAPPRAARTIQWLLPAYKIHDMVLPYRKFAVCLEIVCVNHRVSLLRTEPQVVPRCSESGEGGPTSTVRKVSSRCLLARRCQQLPSSSRPQKVTCLYSVYEGGGQDSRPPNLPSGSFSTRRNKRPTQKPTLSQTWQIRVAARASRPPGRTGCPGAARTWVGKSWWNTVAGW